MSSHIKTGILPEAASAPQSEKKLSHSTGIITAFKKHHAGETRMELLLWRHAEAEEGENDLKRRLTQRGERQARAMARWILQHQPKNLRILVSPAVRTQQTAAALGLPFETDRSLAPDGNVADLIAASNWPGAGGAVLIVGHQPALGQMASLLLSGHEADWTIKKGALWWLSNRVRAGETQTILRAALPPEMAAEMSGARA